jgi:hypothetical protein
MITTLAIVHIWKKNPICFKFQKFFVTCIILLFKKGCLFVLSCWHLLLCTCYYLRTSTIMSASRWFCKVYTNGARFYWILNNVIIENLVQNIDSKLDFWLRLKKVLSFVHSKFIQYYKLCSMIHATQNVHDV